MSTDVITRNGTLPIERRIRDLMPVHRASWSTMYTFKKGHAECQLAFRAFHEGAHFNKDGIKTMRITGVYPAEETITFRMEWNGHVEAGEMSGSRPMSQLTLEELWKAVNGLE